MNSLDHRKTVSVDQHKLFIDSLLTPDDLDDIDAELDEYLQIDPHVTGTNNRRTDTELARILELIDNLPISEDGKESSH